MKTLVLIFLAAFAAVLAWRLVFKKKTERKRIRFAVREVALASAFALSLAATLLFLMYNNTMRIL